MRGRKPHGGAPAPQPAPGVPSAPTVPEPSGAPIPSDNATSVTVEPTSAPTTLETLIVSPTPIAEPVAVNSTAAGVPSATAPTTPKPTSGNGANGVQCSLDALFKAQ